MGTLPDLSTTLRLPWRATSEAGALLYRTLAGGIFQAKTTWSRAVERHRQRQDLITLDARMLKDIGLDRLDAEREHRRSFWEG